MEVVAKGLSAISRGALWALLQVYGVLGLRVSSWRVPIATIAGLSAGMFMWCGKIRSVRLVPRYGSSLWKWRLSMPYSATWSSFPRADFAWASFVALWGWDVRKVGVIGYARPQCADAVRSRYLKRSRFPFQIPSDIRCDRNFLEHARDGCT